MHKQKQTGFTLIELLITIFIITLIIAAVFVFLRTTRLTVAVNEAKLQAAEYAQKGIDSIVRELVLSGANYVRFSSGTRGGWDAIETTTGSTGIKFKVPRGIYGTLDLGDQNELQWGYADRVNPSGDGYIAYAWNSGSGLLTRGMHQPSGVLVTGPTGTALQPQVITSHITAATFQQDNNEKSDDYVVISITATVPLLFEGRSTNVSQTLTSAVKLRNTL